MPEPTLETQRKVRAQCLVQPVTRFVAAKVLTVVNGRLELRPEQGGRRSEVGGRSSSVDPH